MAKKYFETNNNSMLTAVVANQAGEIFELEGYSAVGMAGSLLSPLKAANTRKIPHGSELMYLPDRRPVYTIRQPTNTKHCRKTPMPPVKPFFRWRPLIRPVTLLPISALTGKQKKPDICPCFHTERWDGIRAIFARRLLWSIRNHARICGR